MRLTLCPWRRNSNSPLTGLKSASYAENLLALEYAARHHFNETLWLNEAGDLCEASTANVFLVKDDTLRTPSLHSGCLPGITRAWILAHAEKSGIDCHETRLTETDLAQADEILLSSATRGPVAVAQFSQRHFARSPVASLLHQAWQAAARHSSTHGIPAEPEDQAGA